VVAVAVVVVAVTVVVVAVVVVLDVQVPHMTGQNACTRGLSQASRFRTSPQSVSSGMLWQAPGTYTVVVLVVVAVVTVEVMVAVVVVAVLVVVVAVAVVVVAVVVVVVAVVVVLDVQVPHMTGQNSCTRGVSQASRFRTWPQNVSSGMLWHAPGTYTVVVLMHAPQRIGQFARIALIIAGGFGGKHLPGDMSAQSTLSR
jgi:hypothetical protein